LDRPFLLGLLIQSGLRNKESNHQLFQMETQVQNVCMARCCFAEYNNDMLKLGLKQKIHLSKLSEDVFECKVFQVSTKKIDDSLIQSSSTKRFGVIYP